VSNYDKLQAILNKLETTKKKKEYFEKIYRENGTIVMKKKGYLCCKKEIAPLKDYYA
jgi:CMP-N-acetylneuraminic acid synthetase